MPETPAGFAQASVQLDAGFLQRNAFVTWGVQLGLNGITPQGADQVIDAFVAGIGQHMDSQVTIGPLTLRGGDKNNPLLAVSTADHTVPGGQGSIISLPPNVAVLVNKRTNIGGRRGRGRMFLPFYVSTTDVDQGGTILTNRLDVITAAVTVFHDELANVGMPMVLLHSPGVSTIKDPTPVTSLDVDTRVSTQRRRLR